MHLNKPLKPFSLIIILVIAVLILIASWFIFTSKAQAEEKQFKINFWYQQNNNYGWVVDAPAGCGQPQFKYWDTVWQDDQEREWFGTCFTVNTLEDIPWFRVGLYGKQEKDPPLLRDPYSEVYLVFGCLTDINLSPDWLLKIDGQSQIMISSLEPSIYLHQLSLTRRRNSFVWGPTVYGRINDKPDFFAYGLKTGIENRDWGISGEYFFTDVDWRFSGYFRF